MIRAQVIKYDGNFEELETRDFEWMEDAIRWCEQDAKSPLRWGDTQIGMEGIDEATAKSINESGDYPLEGHPLYQISGADEDEPGKPAKMREMGYEDWKEDEDTFGDLRPAPQPPKSEV